MSALLIAGAAAILVGAVALVAWLAQKPSSEQGRKDALAEDGIEVGVAGSAPQVEGAFVSPREPVVRVTGELRVRGRVFFPRGVVVDGSVVVEDDSDLDALCKVRGDVVLGTRARVTRPLLVHGALRMGRDARVPSCQVDGEVTMAPGAHVEGTLECRSLRLEARDAVPAAAKLAPPEAVVAPGPETALA